jgi:hypothetical protein
VASAIESIAVGLAESIRELEAEVEQLDAKARDLLAQAEQRREEASRQRGVLADLRGRLGSIVGQHLRRHLTQEAADAGTPGDAEHPAHDRPRRRRALRDRGKSAPAGAGTSGGERPMIQRALEVIEAEPTRTWTAAGLLEYFPGLPTLTFNKILKRLCDRKQVVRVGKGEYRLRETAPTGDTTRPADSAAQPAEPATHPPSPALSPGVSVEESVAGVRVKVINLVEQQVGRAWRLEDLASELGESAVRVHAALQSLLRSGQMVTAIDGSYLIPGESPSEEWSHMN